MNRTRVVVKVCVGGKGGNDVKVKGHGVTVRSVDPSGTSWGVDRSRGKARAWFAGNIVDGIRGASQTGGSGRSCCNNDRAACGTMAATFVATRVTFVFFHNELVEERSRGSGGCSFGLFMGGSWAILFDVPQWDSRNFWGLMRTFGRVF